MNGICDGIAVYLVDDGWVDDFVDSVWLSFRRSRAGEDSLLGDVSHTNRVILIEGHSNRVFLDETVLISINRGINSQRENLLMVRRYYSMVDIRTPWYFGPGSDGDGR